MRDWVTAYLFALLLMVNACATTPRSGAQPLLGALEVEPVEVQSVEIAGASAEEPEWFRAFLAEQASATACRAVFEDRLAGVVRCRPGHSGERYRLSARIALPTALPSALRGSRAAFTKGDLATASVALIDGGRTVATADSRVRWRDVRWTTGGPKMRRPRDPALPLRDAAELAIGRAVESLAAEMRATRSGDPPAAQLYR